MFAQEKESNFFYGVDLLNKFLFRGTDIHTGPSLQPYIGTTLFNDALELTVIGVTGVNDERYQELDLLATLYLGSFYVNYTDYFFQNALAFGVFDSKLFELNDTLTTHIMEVQIGFASENFPLSGVVCYNFYGFDQDKSWYLEANYAFKNEINVFAGATLDKGAYKTSDGFGFVNIGLTRANKISLGDYNLPFTTTFAVNPASEKIYLIFGFNL